MNDESPLSQARQEETRTEPVLLDVFGLLWHYRLLIFSTVLLTMLASALFVFQLTPRYTAETQVLIGTRTTNVVDIESVLESLRPDRATVQNEVEVLASRSLAEMVVDELGLLERPEFNRRLRPRHPLSYPLQWLPEPIRAVLFAAEPAASTPEEAERTIRDDTITALVDSLNVETVRISNVVSVAVTTEDAELAATVANKLADIYLREQIEQKLRASEQAVDWLDGRLLTLTEQVEHSERAVEDYRLAQGLTQTSDSTLIEQQISEVNSQLIAARATTAEADARLRQARELMRSEDGIYSAAEVLAAPLIQNLRMQEANLAGEAEQMAQEYGPRHPRMINVRAELTDIRAKIAEEVERIVFSLDNSLEVARTREATLEESIEELKAEAVRLTASQARLRVLEREAAANQALFDMFLARQMETGNLEDLFAADARIISRATVPRDQAWPNFSAAMAISLVVSILLSLLLVFVIEEAFSKGFRDGQGLETDLKVGSFGVVPKLTESGDKESGDTLVDHVLDEPMSAFSESLRMLHTGLLASAVSESRSVSVLVTSSIAEEGKSFLAIAFARLIARSGSRVLLIDADIRHGTVGKRLRLAGEHGLVHLLTGRLKDAGKAIQHDGKSGLDVLVVGKFSEVPTDIVHAPVMSKLLAEFKKKYDLVVIDSPPALLVSDVRTLGRVVDHTVFAVRWASTARKVAAAAIKQLQDSGVRVTGAVLTMAQPHGKGYYGYFGSYRYGHDSYYGSYSKFNRYYAR